MQMAYRTGHPFDVLVVVFREASAGNLWVCERRVRSGRTHFGWPVFFCVPHPRDRRPLIIVSESVAIVAAI